MRTAVVHEWLESYAGAERVVEQILSLFDGADVFSLVDFLPDEQRGFLHGRDVTTSFIQRLPFARHRFRAYLPLMPLAVEQFDLGSYELIVSSNHAVAKGVLTREDQLHVCYIHTPVRYAWDLYHPYLTDHRLRRGPKSLIARLVLHYLRLWDQASSGRVDAFAANSRYVARRVWKTYRRRARVIYPPVDVNRFNLGLHRDDYYVTVSRLVPYKRVDLMVEAFRRMPDRQLIVIGDGPQYESLCSRVPANVRLLGRQNEQALAGYVQSARAFVFAADEDFGISPVEAQACGTPVIAYRYGGTSETVVDGKTGLLFGEQSCAALVSAVEAFEGCREKFDPAVIRAHAEQFSVERFRSRFEAFVDRCWEKHDRRGSGRTSTRSKRLARRSSILPR
jgi:glycosyltransferase involved in cell wall biosynthesis